MSLVELKSVTKTCCVGDARVRVLDGVDLAIEAGEFVALTGPAGGGKSSLLNLIGCLDVPDEGDVLIDGVSTAQLDEAQRDALRGRMIGVSVQSFDLVPVLSARDNVALPLWLHALPMMERDARAAQALAVVGLAPFADCLPSRLSAAQCRRVAMARAIVAGPRMMVADEPTANLEGVEASAFIELMRRLNAVLGLTFVFSTRDARLLGKAKRVIELRDGRIVPPRSPAPVRPLMPLSPRVVRFRRVNKESRR